jgi:ribosomal subunit interface protein
MPIDVTSRHMRASGDLQDYAWRKAEELLEEFSLIEHIHVILDIEKHGKRHEAEVVLQVKRHGQFEAAESSSNLRISLDGAFEKVERQMRRLHDKVADLKVSVKKRASRAGRKMVD